MFRKLGRASFYPGPLRVVLLRKILERMGWVPYLTRLEYDGLDRTHNGFCIYNAASLAGALGYPRISVIELDVAGGRGLINVEYHVEQIRKLSTVDFEVYGFDLGSGLPAPVDYRDMPYMWAQGYYSMDQDKLQDSLKFSKLVIGNVRETCSTFFNDHEPAPIGCALFDLDYYSSTLDAFQIFHADHSNYLPRVYIYFDDIGGGGRRANNEFVGVLKAIEDFNQQSSDQKIARIQGLGATRKVPMPWDDHIFVFHDFSHPNYCDFIGNGLVDLPL